METKNDHTLLLYESLDRGLLTLYQQGKERQQQQCIFLAGMCQGLPAAMGKVQLQETWSSIGLQWHSQLSRPVLHWLDHAFTHYKQQKAFAEEPRDTMKDLSDLSVSEQRSWLHWLLFFALLEIRVEAYETQNREIFSLADTFHLLPLQLERRWKQELPTSEILADLRRRAQRRGYDDWLEQMIKEVTSSWSH